LPKGKGKKGRFHVTYNAGGRRSRIYNPRKRKVRKEEEGGRGGGKNRFIPPEREKRIRSSRQNR